MANHKARTNPFYVLLLLAGVCFVLTACAYGVMAFKGSHGVPLGESGLLPFLDQHGAWLMAGEVGVLILASLAAMLTDGYWSGRGTGNAAARTPRADRQGGSARAAAKSNHASEPTKADSRE